MVDLHLWETISNILLSQRWKDRDHYVLFIVKGGDCVRN